MDCKIVAQSYLTASSSVLAAQLAMLDQSTLAKLLKSKTVDLFSEEKGKFNHLVEDLANQLKSELPGELVLRIFGVLNAILDIPPRRYVAPRDFEDNCEEILTRCLACLRESEPDFAGKDLQDMLHFLMNKMFGEIGTHFDSLSCDKQQQVVDEIRKYIDSLPEAQRDKLRKEIGADQITDGYIRKAIVSGTLSSAFAAAVSVGGFAFYTGAVSLCATLAGLIGLTLPFSFYVGLTSTVAVVSNPLFLIPLLAGGGWWLYSHQNHDMRCRLAPLLVAQSVITHLACRPDGSDHTDQALKLWQVAWAAVEQARSKLVQAESALTATEDELTRIRNKIGELNRKLKQLESDQKQIHIELKILCRDRAADMACSNWGSAVRETGKRLKTCLDKIVVCRNRPVKPGFSGIFNRMGRSFDAFDAEQKAEQAAGEAACAVIEAAGKGASTYPAAVQTLVKRHSDGEFRRNQLDSELAENKKTKSALEKKRASEEHHRSLCQSERDRTETKYWGLSKLK